MYNGVLFPGPTWVWELAVNTNLAGIYFLLAERKLRAQHGLVSARAPVAPAASCTRDQPPGGAGRGHRAQEAGADAPPSPSQGTSHVVTSTLYTLSQMNN